MLRRVISTTANYFLILSIPMPDIRIDSQLADSIITATRTIRNLRSELAASDEMLIASLRCQIDIAVAQAYSIEEANFAEDIRAILRKPTVSATNIYSVLISAGERNA